MIREESLITTYDMKVGDTIRIKSLQEIKETLDGDEACEGVFFSESMHKYCDALCTISYVNLHGSLYRMKENSFTWIEKWLKPVCGFTYLNDGSIKQRSLCLALIRQAMSGNPVDLEVFLNLSSTGGVLADKRLGGFNFGDYPQDDWRADIARNIPDWPCLKLKPEVLEKAIINCLTQHNLRYLEQTLISRLTSWFIFVKTGKEDFWFRVSEELNSALNNEIAQPLKQTKNETELQRKKASVVRGDLPEGSEQRSGKSKAAVVRGHLCYNICAGGQEA